MNNKRSSLERWNVGTYLSAAQARLLLDGPNVVKNTFFDRAGGRRWIAFAKPVACPSVVLDYLARNVHRTALSGRAIVACANQSVTFAYRDNGGGRRKAMPLHRPRVSVASCSMFRCAACVECAPSA